MSKTERQIVREYLAVAGLRIPEDKTNGNAGGDSQERRSRCNWPDPLAEEAYYGLAGEIVKAIEPHSEADPAALLMQLLVGCGNIIGRKPFFVTEETLQYMSLYVVLVGQTAKARKGTSWGRTRGTLDRKSVV